MTSTSGPMRGNQSDGDDEWGHEEEVVVWSVADNENGGAGLSFRGRSSSNSAELREGRARAGSHALLIASLANLAISYNVVNIGLALKLMGHAHDRPATATEESLVSTGAILGMIVGQILFGMAGDYLGRQPALMYTLIVCFLGAVGSTLVFKFEKGSLNIYQQLLFWRILLGVGAGGVYPLAATLARSSGVDWAWLKSHRRSKVTSDEGAARGSLPENEASENAQQEDKDTGSTAVALMFSMQGLGYLAAHVTGYLLLLIFPGRPGVAARLLLGLGAVPPLAVVLMVSAASARARYYALAQDRREGGGDGVVPGGGREDGGGVPVLAPGRGGVSSPTRVWLSLRDKKTLLSKLVGTAGSWFLFDVTFYGNQLYQEDVLEQVFGDRSSLKSIAGQDSILALVALPGYFVAVAFIGRLGPRLVQVQGFVAMAVLFAIIGIIFKPPLGQHAYILMTLYSLTFFFSNFGPNSTTFMLPSLTFPDQFRGSLNGVSAAAGKLGALLGSLLFEPAARAWGVGAVLMMCAAVSLAGGALTLVFIDSNSLEDDQSRLELPSRDSSTSSGAAIHDHRNISIGINGNGSQNGHNSSSPNGLELPRERTPLASTEHKGLSHQSKNGKGQYSMVGVSEEVHHGTFIQQETGQRRDMRDGSMEYFNLSRGRGGGVEGEAQVVSGDHLGSDSDSDGGVTVVGRTHMALV